MKTEHIDRVLERAVAEARVPGVIALAANDKGVVYQGAFGKRGVDSDSPMTVDTVFWIASMTKALTSVAAMQLVEKGKLHLDEPLSQVLPELDSIQVLEGFDSTGTPQLRASHKAITLRHLLTHTAGFTYNFFNADTIHYIEHAGLPGITECKNAALFTPLAFDPGDRWEYGINTDWVGKAVEAASGQTLRDYFKEHILNPLDMSDTDFIIQPDWRSRLASMHQRDTNGLISIPFEVTQDPEFHMGGGGLYSTAGDYITLLQMLLQGGTLGEVRILQPETVQEMSRNQIGDLNVTAINSAIPALTNNVDFYPDMVKKWGLGFMITTEDLPTGRSAGSLAWAGLANTYYWIDPVKRVTGVIMTQILPFADESVLNLLAEFETAIYANSDQIVVSQTEQTG
jgi:methyl acetate hydrolase